MAMTPEQKAKAKQNMEDTGNMSWDDVKQSWSNSGQSALDAINPNKNRMIDPNAQQQQAMPTDPAAMTKVRAMMGITPQSRQDHQTQMLKQQQQEAMEAAQGADLMKQMEAMGDEGFETVEQTAARKAAEAAKFGKVKALMGR